MKPYKDSVSLDEIIADGWSRGFHSSQTLKEAKEMGFDLTLGMLLTAWSKLDKSYKELTGSVTSRTESSFDVED